jgi:hypothetical protein
MTADLDSTFMDADETSAAPTAQAESQDDTELVETHAAPTPELAWSAEADTELIDGGSRGRWVVAVAALLVAIGAVAGASLFLWVHQTTAPTPAASQTPHPSAVPAPPPVAAPPAPAPTSTVAAPATTVAAPPQRTVLPPGNADPNDHSDLFLADAHRRGFTSVQGDYGLLEQSSEVCRRLAHGEQRNTLAQEMVGAGFDLPSAQEFIRISVADLCPS